MKKTLLILSFCFSYYCGMAQNHTYNACCRYSKSNVMGDCSCPGCQKDKNDEIKASQEETKQLQAKVAAEQAKKAEEIKKFKEEVERKKVADQKQRDENKITIGNPNPDKKPAKAAKFADNLTDKTVMVPFNDDYADRGFKDTLGKVLFYTKRNNIVQQGFENSSSGYVGNFVGISYLYSYPKYMGTVGSTYGFGGITASGISREVRSYVDIVYPNGKLEFKDEKIISILHLVEVWFMLEERLSRESDEETSYLYNLKTKQKIELPKISIQGYGSIKYTPIFQEKLYKVSGEKPYLFNKFSYDQSIKLKTLLIKKYPDKVNEKLLEDNLFCIVIGTDYNTEYIEKGINFQIVYLTKEGKFFYK